MDYKIDGRMIFLLVIIVFLGVTFYSIIEVQERPHSKTQVCRILREDFFRNRSGFQNLALFATNVESYSNEWWFEVNENKLSYFSDTPFDSCKIPLQEYVFKYYKGVDAGVSPMKVPDFNVPAKLENILDSLNLSSLHYSEEGLCGKKNITLKYRNDIFNPENRIIVLKYFPDGMCKEMIENIKKSDNKWNWIIYLDKNWIAESVKKNH